MRFEVSAKLKYEVLAPSTIILSVQAYRYGGQVVTEESFSSDPELKTLEWVADRGEKVFKVLDIPDKGLITLQYKAMVDNGCKQVLAKTLDEVPVSLMPANVLPYLNPSRYCQSDKLYKFASTNFGIKRDIPTRTLQHMIRLRNMLGYAGILHIWVLPFAGR
jgi:hypothetical protein